MIDELEGGSKRQKLSPALSIPVNHVVPSSLHIVLGLVEDIVGAIEICAKSIRMELYLRIQSIFSKYRVERKAWYGKFNGNFLSQYQTFMLKETKLTS
jgi:hypothetical protein